MRNRGFTLIELLVVLVIVGLLVAMAALTIGDNRGAQLDREARRLHQVIRLAGEEAILKSQIIGIRFEHDGYRFSLFAGADDWQPIEHDRFLRPHTLPENMRLDLVLEGLADAGAQQRDQPQVLLLTSGEMIPFELTVSHLELPHYYLIEGHLDGRLEFHPPD